MSIDFDMSEVKALAAQLARADVGAKATARIATKLAATALSAASKAKVGVDSGDTRASIHVEDDGDDSTVIADTEAAFFHHFGTSDTAPNPFMWSNIPAASRVMAAALEEVDPFKTR